MKRFFHTFLTAAAFALFFLVQPHTASASLQYLDDDPNYPVSYYHANYREYVDLSSCTFSDEDPDYYTYATGYVAYYRDAESKDGGSNPQFYSARGQWLSMPVFDYDEIWRYIKSRGYTGYIDDYHAYPYYMFKIVYQKTRGVEYPDNLHGQKP